MAGTATTSPGATDTLSTLARAGLKSLLFLRMPTPAQLARAGALDAVGIAGAARSMAPEAMRAGLEPVGRFFAEAGIRLLHYKCCSTFDSAPEVGSIGTAVATLRPDFPNRLLPIIGGQPGLGRYCLFGNLFAAAGTGGEVFRLDRHPTMRNHPVTPMLEADLRLHLAQQGIHPVLMPYPAYAQPDLAATLRGLLAAGPEAVLFDVAQDADLPDIGALLWDHAAAAPMLAVGPSSVAQALAPHWPGGARSAPRPRALAPARGPVFVLAGSLSPVTRRQIEQATSYTRVDADPARMIADPNYAAALAQSAAAQLRSGRHLLVATTPPTGTPPPAEAVAQATAQLLHAVTAQYPVRRLGIAGGDTSSLGTQALNLWGLSYAGLLAPGVTLCRAHSDDGMLDGMEMMLKGGQMGPPELFEMLVR